MPRLSNPNSGKPYDRVIKDLQGNEVYGIRNEHQTDEEIVHIPTGRSNQTYYQPEMVLNPEGCDHSFKVTSMATREVECSKCFYQTTFHPALNYTEENGHSFITLKDKKYPIFH